MKSKKVKSHQQSSPYPVIVTGCPHSGWEVALLALGHLKLENAAASAGKWLDLVFEKAGQDNPFKSDSNIEPDFSQLNASFKTDAATGLADERYIHLLEQCASQYPNARFLLFYTRAEIALASAIEKGTDPDEFIKAWRQANQRLIQFQRRYRSRALLFDAEAVASTPSGFAQSCLAIGVESRDKETAIAEAPVPYPGAIECLVASHLLAGAAEVFLLQDELEASATPLDIDEAGLTQNVTKALDEYLEHKASLDQLTHDRDEYSQQLEDVRKQLKVTEADRDKKARAVETENKKLKVQNEQFSSDLEANKKPLAETAKQADELKQELNKARQETEAQKKKQTDITQENELLLLQLHQVQEELEHYYLLYQESSEKIQQAEAEAEAAQLAAEQEVESVPAEEVGKTNSTGLLGLFGGEKARAQKKVQEKIRLLNDSGLVDKKWYLTQYPDVAEQNYDPVKHYLKFGAAEDRDPSPEFSTSYYVSSNPDILKSSMNPLVHYIRFGRDEGRLPRDMSAD